MTRKGGITGFLEHAYKCFGAQDAIEFVGEAFVIHRIMKRKNIQYSRYLIMQGDMDSALNTIRELVKLWRAMYDEYERQKKVQDLMNLPNWMNEDQQTPPIEEFKELTIRNIKFTYQDAETPAIDFLGNEMIFERGKRYGLVGKNMAGKSTLAHIICKLYDPEQGQLEVNGIPYAEFGRQSIREIVCYASQNPFLFPGTIGDNIKIGNPYATDDEGEKLQSHEFVSK